MHALLQDATFWAFGQVLMSAAMGLNFHGAISPN
jgi:hypothetical protein